MPRTGGELVVETLKAAGVDTVFGIVSVHNIPIYDAMARLGGIQPVMVRHEQGAVAMADGYARASGKLGVALTSTGPGAANGMGSMVEAYWANSPVLHLTGNVETQHLGKAKGFVHEAKDQLAMLATASKWTGRPEDTGQIPAVLAQAIGQALSGRQRPVAVEIPIDLQYYTAEVPIPPVRIEPAPKADAAAIRRAAGLLASARRPLLLVGGGAHCSGAGPEVLALARSLGAGIVTTISGRGAVPEDDPLTLGYLVWEPLVQQLLADADVLLAVGTRFAGPNTMNWTLQLPPTIVHIDIDGGELDRNYPAAVGINADAKAALGDLIAQLDGRRGAEAGWEERVKDTRLKARRQQRHNIGPGHEQILDDVRAALPRDGLIVKDATIPAYIWGNRLLEVYEPRTSIHSTSSAIGPGLPLAIGALLSAPGRPVVLIAGDGGFLLNIAELSTAAQYKLPVRVLVFNDQGYGVLRIHQNMTFGGRHIAVDMNPIDFAKVAEGFGVASRKVPTAGHFAEAFDWALAQDGPALLEVDLKGVAPMTVPYTGTSRPPKPRD